LLIQDHTPQVDFDRGLFRPASSNSATPKEKRTLARAFERSVCLVEVAVRRVLAIRETSCDHAVAVRVDDRRSESNREAIPWHVVSA
jgi:hypothetical protein